MTSDDSARIKRRYAQYLTEARRQAETSVDKALAAIDRLDGANRRRNFLAFKARLAEEVDPATGRPLAKDSVTATLKALLRTYHPLLVVRPNPTLPTLRHHDPR